MPRDVIGIGSAIKAVYKLGKPDERQRHFGAAVLDDVVHGHSWLDAVWVTVVEANPVTHLLHDAAGQDPDLVIAQGGEARPGLGFGKAVLVADSGGIGPDGSGEPGVIGGGGFEFIGRAERVALGAGEQGRPGGHGRAVHVECALREDRPGDAPVVAEHLAHGIFVALGEEPGTRVGQLSLASGEVIQHVLKGLGLRHVGSPADDGRRARKEETVEQGRVRHPGAVVVRNKAAGVIIARDVIIAVKGHETLRDLEERVLVAQAEVRMRILGEGKGRR